MAVRAIWKGAIELDDLEIPVKLYAAIEDRSVHFHWLHDQDLVRLRQRMVNAATGREVVLTDASRGYEVEPGRFVLVEPREQQDLEPAESRTIKVDRFVDPAQIGPQWYDRPYYLGPDAGAADAYWALLEALQRRKKMALVRWVMRKKQYAGGLRIERGYLALITLRSPAEVVDAGEIKAPTGRKMDPREIHMAEQLIAALEGEFDPRAFHNDYVQRVRDLVERKAGGQRIETPKAPPPKPKSESLQATLKASIESVKKDKAHARR